MCAYNYINIYRLSGRLEFDFDDCITIYNSNNNNNNILLIIIRN